MINVSEENNMSIKNDLTYNSSNEENQNDLSLLLTINNIKNSKKCFYGSIYLLNYLSKTIGLDDILSTVFLDYADKIKALAFFNILEHKPLMYCSNFVRNYDICLSPSELSSQRISEILKNISDKDKMYFYNLWANKINDKEYLALDSTSISTYSSIMAKSANGYNKQHEKLKQVNLCFIFGEKSGLPVYSSVYNGSLHDVTTLIDGFAKSPRPKNVKFWYTKTTHSDRL
jgi:transposase